MVDNWACGSAIFLYPATLLSIAQLLKARAGIAVITGVLVMGSHRDAIRAWFEGHGLEGKGHGGVAWQPK